VDTRFSAGLTIASVVIVDLLSIHSDVLRNSTIRGPERCVKIDDTMVSRETPPRRKYELKKRADEMARTHRRITEAAIELHGTAGPSRTTLSEVARRAGVERRTLYRHFPNEADLFAACSSHYFTANPPPDLGTWRAIPDPQERLERALDELYAYYERTEPMLRNVLRDAELVDLARDAVAPLQAYLDDAAEILTAGRRARGRRRQLLTGALRHALAFSTWRSLTTGGLGRADAAGLMTALVEAAGDDGTRRR
jgi:AcrR family transcriptional regulator